MICLLMVISGLSLSFVPHERNNSFIEIDARCILIVWRVCVDCLFDDLFMFLIFFLHNMNRPRFLPMAFYTLLFIFPWEKHLYEW
jgi:hypothetical protein